MGIEGIPPISDPASRIEKSEVAATPKASQVSEVKSAAPVASTPGKSTADINKVLAQANADTAKTGNDKQAPAKISRSVAELQAMAEKMRTASEQSIIRSEMMSVESDIVQTRQELADLSGETTQMALDMASGGIAKLSYWEQLDLSEKTRKINELKDKIRGMELERNKYVQSLRDQVVNGSYSVSGSEILNGMLEEWI